MRDMCGRHEPYTGAVVDEMEARFVAFGSAIIARNAALSVEGF